MSFRVHPISPAVVDVVRLSREDGYGNTDLRPIVVKDANTAPCRVCLRMADVGAQGLPAVLRTRFLLVRAYDAEDSMVVADAVEGARLEETVERFFADRRVTTIHVHNARQGYFLCRIDRA